MLKKIIENWVYNPKVGTSHKVELISSTLRCSECRLGVSPLLRQDFIVKFSRLKDFRSSEKYQTGLIATKIGSRWTSIVSPGDLKFSKAWEQWSWRQAWQNFSELLEFFHFRDQRIENPWDEPWVWICETNKNGFGPKIWEWSVGSSVF